MSNQPSPLTNNELQRLAPSVFAGHAHAGVSSRYSFLPTIQVVDELRGAGWLPVKAQEQRIRAEGRAGFQKHLIRFQRESDLARYDATSRRLGDITPEIVLVNSHDRTSAYQLHAALFRLACLNGMVVADSTLARVAITHVDFDPAAVIRASLDIAEEMPRVLDRVSAWQDRTLTAGESRVFAEAALMLKYDTDDLSTVPVSAEKLLEARRAQDTGSDLWRTFNRVQENLTQGGQKEFGRRVPAVNSDVRKRRAPRTRAVEGIDANVKLNKALWHLAEYLNAGGKPAEV